MDIIPIFFEHGINKTIRQIESKHGLPKGHRFFCVDENSEFDFCIDYPSKDDPTKIFHEKNHDFIKVPWDDEDNSNDSDPKIIDIVKIYAAMSVLLTNVDQKSFPVSLFSASLKKWLYTTERYDWIRSDIVENIDFQDEKDCRAALLCILTLSISYLELFDFVSNFETMKSRMKILMEQTDYKSLNNEPEHYRGLLDRIKLALVTGMKVPFSYYLWKHVDEEGVSESDIDSFISLLDFWTAHEDDDVYHANQFPNDWQPREFSDDNELIISLLEEKRHCLTRMSLLSEGLTKKEIKEKMIPLKNGLHNLTDGSVKWFSDLFSHKEESLYFNTSLNEMFESVLSLCAKFQAELLNNFKDDENSKREMKDFRQAIIKILQEVERQEKFPVTAITQYLKIKIVFSGWNAGVISLKEAVTFLMGTYCLFPFTTEKPSNDQSQNEESNIVVLLYLEFLLKKKSEEDAAAFVFESLKFHISHPESPLLDIEEWNTAISMYDQNSDFIYEWAYYASKDKKHLGEEQK